MKKKDRYFWCGLTVAMCCQSLFEDFLGKDLYLTYVQNHWVSGCVTVPIALVGLVLAVGIYDRGK